MRRMPYQYRSGVMIVGSAVLQESFVAICLYFYLKLFGIVKRDNQGLMLQEIRCSWTWTCMTGNWVFVQGENSNRFVIEFLTD